MVQSNYFLGWILFGFVVGLVARAVLPGRGTLGLIGYVVLGIFGAIAAGWIGAVFGLYDPREPTSFVAASLGAIAVLAGYSIFNERRQQRAALENQENRPRAA